MHVDFNADAHATFGVGEFGQVYVAEFGFVGRSSASHVHEAEGEVEGAVGGAFAEFRQIPGPGAGGVKEFHKDKGIGSRVWGLG